MLVVASLLGVGPTRDNLLQFSNPGPRLVLGIVWQRAADPGLEGTAHREGRHEYDSIGIRPCVRWSQLVGLRLHGTESPLLATSCPSGDPRGGGVSSRVPGHRSRGLRSGVVAARRRIESGRRILERLARIFSKPSASQRTWFLTS